MNPTTYFTAARARSPIAMTFGWIGAPACPQVATLGRDEDVVT